VRSYRVEHRAWSLRATTALVVAVLIAGCGTAEEEQAAAPEPAPEPEPEPGPAPEPEAQATACHPSYQGACLDPDAADYDCEGGSGDGPEYTGEVTIVGDDPYGLDAGGTPGVGCED